MLAFRFCVVVSAGAIMILGQGVLGTSAADLASSEIEQSEDLRRSTSPQARPESQGENLVGGDSQHQALPLEAQAVFAAPNPQEAEDSDESFSEPIILVESQLPNTETVLNAFTRAIADAPDVQLSQYNEGNPAEVTPIEAPKPGNAQDLLERINAAIAQNNTTDAIRATPSSETVVMVESTLPNTQAVLSAFEAAATTSPDIKISTYRSRDLLEAGSIEADFNITPPAFLSQDNFTPFERILSHFQRHQPTVTATPPKPLANQDFTPFARVLEGRGQSEAAAAIANAPELPVEGDRPTVTNVLPEAQVIVEAFSRALNASPQSSAATAITPDEAPSSIIPTPEDENVITPDDTIPTLEEEADNPATPEISEPLTPNNQNPNTRELIENPQPATTLDAIQPDDTLAPNANPLLRPAEIDDVQVDVNEPISLEEAVALALRNNPTLRQTRLELNVAQESLREALAAEYPNLSTQFNFSRSDSAQSRNNSGGDNAALLDQLGVNSGDSTNTSAEGRLELSYNVYTGGRRSAQINAAERGVRLNQLEVERIAAETKFNTLRAYYAVQEADARVRIEQAAVTDAERSLRDAQLLEEAGLGTRFDVLQAQVQRANNIQNLTNALSQQEVAQRELAVVLGLGQTVAITAADEIEPAGQWELNLEETLLLAYQNRAELEQSLVQREINEQQRQIALAGIKPQLSVFANYNILGITGDDQGLGDGYTFGARMQWTLFDGGAAQARAAQQATNIQIAETQFDQRLDQIRLEVEQAYRSLIANQENIQTAQTALQLAQESLRLARLRFGAGVGTQTEVINAQTELTRARGNLLTAIINYNRDLAALQRSVTNLPDNRLFDLPE
jgi:outer membrane protein TolC